MRKAVAAFLAVPVLVRAYVASSRRLRLPSTHALVIGALPLVILGVSLVRGAVAPVPMLAADAADAAGAGEPTPAAGVAGVVAAPELREPALGAPGAEAAAVAARALAAVGEGRPLVVSSAGAPTVPVRAPADRARRFIPIAPTDPAVVRFRPVAGATEVARSAEVSVRFTESMERAATTKAFSVTVNGKPVTGTVRWAEDSTVLVLKPKAAFPAGA
ncbi:MAG: Bacterial Ig-like domain, partial [Chloroflexota bacterium]